MILDESITLSSRWPAFPVPPIDDTPTARAANFLRRFYRNVFSASVLPARERAKLPQHGNDIYLIDGRPMSADDLVRMAEARGFQRREMGG